MDQIPLNEALICINCHTICRLPKRYCPHCAGEQLMPIASWLSPKPNTNRPREIISADPFPAGLMVRSAVTGM